MTAKTVADKMGIRPGIRAILIEAPDAAVRNLQLPEIDLEDRLTGQFDYIHLFVTAQNALDAHVPRLKPHLGPRGKLWVSWPKKRQLGTDLTLREVIRIGYAHGLVESTTLSVDATWSAIKFTHPIEGKDYNNSYGTLPPR